MLTATNSQCSCSLSLGPIREFLEEWRFSSLRNYKSDPLPSSEACWIRTLGVEIGHSVSWGCERKRKEERDVDFRTARFCSAIFSFEKYW
jgi:hypothetical protein